MTRRKQIGADHKVKIDVTVGTVFVPPTSSDDGYHYKQASACIRLGKYAGSSEHRKVCGNGRGESIYDAIAEAVGDLAHNAKHRKITETTTETGGSR